ncbi:MAG: pirin family protein [Paracoccus sp. (in: a-proteobacteria)]|uniref:pirin family protein n=1 Tax=Paracoccus sp. TaxID=267 RepID=UPI0026E0E7EE|nr:pirin family protein [Paracoccus sp. (in: a-proteobacteria)]MDO5614126.1 pirin family protein [Paracoccus sp. (in: a-proteobacteria)]
MSNLDRHPDEAVLERGRPCNAVEVLEPRLVPLGGPRAMTVHRTLPQRERSMVGAWCFLDHYGPDHVAATGGMRVPRHPHTGLATVSWLFTGDIDHLDSAGNAAVVRPGELNLMFAGRGITHSEFSTPDTEVLHGVQLWFALPDATRFSAPGLTHFVPDPVEAPGLTARVFIGELLGSRSPVDTRTGELLGAELRIDPDRSVTLDVRADFEHAVLAVTGTVAVDGTPVAHRGLGSAPPGAASLTLTAGHGGARIILLGGVPFDEQIVMWWNFVGRTHDEIVEFRRRYQAEIGVDARGGAPDAGAGDDRDAALFGPFPEGQPLPLPAPELPTVRLRPRDRGGAAATPSDG